MLTDLYITFFLPGAFSPEALSPPNPSFGYSGRLLSSRELSHLTCRLFVLLPSVPIEPCTSPWLHLAFIVNVCLISHHPLPLDYVLHSGGLLRHPQALAQNRPPINESLMKILARKAGKSGLQARVNEYIFMQPRMCIIPFTCI